MPYSFLDTINDNYILFAPLAALISAQLLKVVVALLFNKNFPWRYFWQAGGFPSSHSSTVTALALAVGINYGWTSGPFTIILIFALIVIYDAMGVRRAVGRQAQILNQLQKELVRQGCSIPISTLKEAVGHSPVEVAAGIMTGFLIVGILGKISLT